MLFYKRFINIYYRCNDCSFYPSWIYFNIWLYYIYLYYNIDNSINIILVNEKKIVFLNKKYRYINMVTNVLSFRYYLVSSINFFLGDIFLCPKLILFESIKNNIDYFYYFSKILIHSMLHILGYSHYNELNYKKMFYLESFFLSKLI